MKNSILKVAVFGLVAIGMVAEANTAAKRSASSTSAPKSNVNLASASGSGRFGMGFATYGGPGGTPTLSGWLELNQLHSLQIVANIAGTNPFQFGAGAVYRFNVVGDPSLGAHVGLGANLGTVAGTGAAAATTSFFLNIIPLGGFHFSLGGHASNVMLSFDGGALLRVTPSPVDFQFAPYGTMAGASIHYFF